ncbi:annexin D3-like [Vitis riparia]|uniref:annexin D3-like n=1 Tax=Vitis riparia TaxID=96939 RepID=UPI00155A5389|nr:annexin D3-like [Vitis riparia]
MEAENDKVVEKDYLDLLHITTEAGEEEDNQLFQWVRPLHLDDEDGNSDPRIATHVQETSVNVERLLFDKVHNDSFNQDTRDSFLQGTSQSIVTSRPSFDSTSVEHSSRPSAASTSASGYDGSRGEETNDGSDPGNDGQDLVVGLVSSYRHDRELVDFNLAKSEAAKLHEVIEKKQLDHDDVVWILTTRNFFQLRETFVCYKQSYEVAIDQAINSSGNGDLGSILRGVILCIVSLEKHFAEVIRASNVGYWTKDEDSLTRAIMTWAKIDMTKIKGEYFKMNNTNLDDVVRRDASGVYKSFLMALIGAKI